MRLNPRGLDRPSVFHLTTDLRDEPMKLAIAHIVSFFAAPLLSGLAGLLLVWLPSHAFFEALSGAFVGFVAVAVSQGVFALLDVPMGLPMVIILLVAFSLNEARRGFDNAAAYLGTIAGILLGAAYFLYEVVLR